MAIITISRGSYSKGKEVAEKVAARLGYGCVSRDVLLDAVELFHIPEIKLVRAIHDAPSLLERFGHGKEEYLAYIQSAFTRRALGDNVVYHGLAGHMLIRGVPHVLKVRVIADLDDRAAAEAARENISLEQARALIVKDDEERRRWTRALFEADPCDPGLYDLVVHIHKLQVEDAVDLICDIAKRPAFQATPAGQQRIKDLALACQVKAALMKNGYPAKVTSDYGNLLVYTASDDHRSRRLEERLAELTRDIEGIGNLELRAGVPAPATAC